MHIQSIIFAVLLTAAPAVAFTNGSLVPAYICNPNSDGLPKSFGQLLQFTVQKTAKIGFSTDANKDIKAPALAQPNNSTIGNSAYILASFHDSPNSVKSINQGIIVKTANGGPIIAGTANQLILSSGSANVALKGALLYAQDSNGIRQGSFSDKGGSNTFIPFPGCGKNPQGQVSGVIQQTGISATGTYSSLFYNAPDSVPSGSLTIAGLSVTGNGFGTWTYTFAVTGGNGGNKSCNGA